MYGTDRFASSVSGFRPVLRHRASDWESGLAATIEGAEASPWFHGAPLSAQNEAAARRAGADLMRRALAALDKDAPDRAAAARELRERAGGGADALIAEMSEANADGQRRATVALLDWFGDAA